jgi:hypothetical protein
MKIPFSQNGMACGLLREKLEKVAEADIRSAYAESSQRPEIVTIPVEIYDETVNWMESIADFDSLVSNQR